MSAILPQRGNFKFFAVISQQGASMESIKKNVLSFGQSMQNNDK